MIPGGAKRLVAPAILLITCVCGASSLFAQGEPASSANFDQRFGAAGQSVPADLLSPAPLASPSSTPPTSDLPPAANPTPGGSTSDAQTASNDSEVIPLKVEGGSNLLVPVLINGRITLDFTIDSGATDVAIPADVVSTLMRTGTLQESDFIGKATYRLADGSTIPSVTFLIRSLKVGNHILENVRGSVADAKADLLLGQSFLNRFNSWSIDNKRQVLLLNPPSARPPGWTESPPSGAVTPQPQTASPSSPPLSPSESQPGPVTDQLQKRCGEDAAAFFVLRQKNSEKPVFVTGREELTPVRPDFNDYESNYSSRLNECFVLTKLEESVPEDHVYTHIEELWDINAHRQLGFASKTTRNGRLTGWSCRLNNTDCDKLGEPSSWVMWNALVGPYMQDIGWAGLEFKPITPEIADSMGPKTAAGVLVTQPMANGPADKAGVKSGDVITAVNGKPVRAAQKLTRLISTMTPGTTVTLNLIHDGQQKTVSFTLGTRPNSPFNR